MQRALLLTSVVLLAWIAGHLASPGAPPAVLLPPPVIVHLPPPPQAPDPLPPPPPSTWQDRGRNRFPLADAPRVLTSWSGLVAAPDAPVLAVWNDATLAWSPDDGATWTRHALSVGETVKLAAAERGWVHLLVAGPVPALWSFAPDGARTVRPSPVASTAATLLVAGGGRLVVLGPRLPAAGASNHAAAGDPLLRSSTDHGLTWSDLPTPESGNAGEVLHVEPNGALVHMNGQEAPCGGGYQHRARLAPGASEWESLPWPLDTPLAFWLGAGGWAYASGDCRVTERAANDAAPHLCAVALRDAAASAGPALDPAAPPHLVSSGRFTFALAGRALFTVKGAAFRRVASDVPTSLEQGTAAIDSAGRLVAIAAGRVVRWSAAGWEVLLPG